MSKKCCKCNESFQGFGSQCATCRRKPLGSGATANVTSTVGTDLCHSCGKRVYAMERRFVEGLVFHKDCFRCTTCSRKLENNYGKSELGIFCMAHFHQITKVTGGYRAGTGPTRNAAAAELV